MNAPAPVPSPSPRSIEERLADLGLTLEVFQTAGKQHLAKYFECLGTNYPVTYPPTSAWAEGNKSIRDGLKPHGWTAKNERNQPLVINKDETIAITALSGDENTGTDETPSTRSPKGRNTAEAVESNNQQYLFEFMEDPAAVAQLSKEGGRRKLFIFLTYRDTEKGELRSELSCPVVMSEDGYIDKWSDRIIFPPIPFDKAEGDAGNPNPNSGNDDGGQTPEITVNIRKL